MYLKLMLALANCYSLSSVYRPLKKKLHNAPLNFFLKSKWGTFKDNFSTAVVETDRRRGERIKGMMCHLVRTYGHGAVLFL